MGAVVVGSAFTGVTGATSVTVTKPTGVADNDLLLCFITTNNSSAPSTQPFTTVEASHTYSTSYSHRLYSKVASSEGASWTWSGYDSGSIMATLIVIRGGFNTADPVDVVSNTEYVTENVEYRAATMTVTAVGSPLIAVASTYSTSTQTFSQPTNGNVGDRWQEIGDLGNDTADMWHGWYIVPRWESSGATGAIDIQGASAGTSKHAIMIALTPATLDEDISIERKAGAGGTYAEEADIAWSTTQPWADTDTFTNGVTYFYRARRQLDNAAYSAYSLEDTVLYEAEGTEYPEAGAVAFALTAVSDIGIPPIVTVWTVTDITDTDAWSGGTIVKAGSSSITARGVCWNTTGNPTIADDHTHD